jgi:hypothetical protein
MSQDWSKIDVETMEIPPRGNIMLQTPPIRCVSHNDKMRYDVPLFLRPDKLFPSRSAASEMSSSVRFRNMPTCADRLEVGMVSGINPQRQNLLLLIVWPGYGDPPAFS